MGRATEQGGTIQNCYATGAISAVSGSLGGVLGSTLILNINGKYSHAELANCYWFGSVLTYSGSKVSGTVIGEHDSGAVITNCYYGFVNDNAGAGDITDDSTERAGERGGETAVPVQKLTAAQFADGEAA